MNNAYTVINASAGSGKTYTLVQRILMVCLRYPNQEEHIGSVLALTFTNKAANEMKDRILLWLKKFTKNDYAESSELINLKKALENENIKVTLEDLHFRSQKLLDYILHHYSTLNISTIDKFNSRLVRSFSYELGLAQNFNLEIQAEPYLVEAVDRMLNQIGENDQISDVFMDYINYNLDNNHRINVNQSLYDSAKVFLNDIHYEPLKQNADFDWERYAKTNENLRLEISALKKASLKKAKQSLELIQENGIENSDFAGGGNKTIQYFFESYLNKEEPKLYASPEEEEKKIQSYLKGTSKSGEAKQEAIFEILDTLLENRKFIILNYIEQRKKEKILNALLPLKVNKEIQDELQKIEDENDLVLLSKFNVLINENLKNEPSAFIYEKIGTRFQHYFFDEFQDTSVLQWQNFIPLRDHALSSEHTSFTIVGDPKQSIYRFRGGESQLMLDIINGKENTIKPAEVVVLRDNFRSASNIVDFNNRLYHYQSKFLKEEHQVIFGKDAEQHSGRPSGEGRVKVHLIENDINDVVFSEMAERMQNDIQECLDSGFRFSDITILCRGNTEIFKYSQLLGHLKVRYKDEETYIRTISESGLTLELSYTLKALIEFVKWQLNPKNRQFLVMMMYYLNELGRIQIDNFTKEIQELLKMEKDSHILDYLQEHFNLNFNNKGQKQLNLYNQIEFYLHIFSVDGKEINFILNFLELVYGFTQNAGAGLKDFLTYWEEEACKKSIQASENVDAVQIMTVHKSKGLEFPIVFLPMFNKSKDNEFNDWFKIDDAEGLHNINLGHFENGFSVYNPEIEIFNTKNQYKNLLDRFCIQYVATTRTKDQLFLYLEKPSKSRNYLELFDFVNENFNPENTNEFDVYPFSKTIKTEKEKPQNTASVLNLKPIFSKNQGLSQIKIATPSKNYQTRNEKVKEGIFLHEILSKIGSENDIEPVLDVYILKGLITISEKKTLRQKLLDIVSKYPLYFGESVFYTNEQDIMISKNGKTEISRPDRMVKTENGWCIIDFKTGKEMSEHQKQIEHYRTLLSELGYPVTKTEIIYI